MIRIGIDIGGVLSKFPDLLRPVLAALRASKEVDIYVISDMHPKQKVLDLLCNNGFLFHPDRVFCADFEGDGEDCKRLVAERLGLDILVDDHMGYLMGARERMLRLLVMPDPDRDYYHASWKTDGSEGNFGRRRNPTASKRPPE